MPDIEQLMEMQPEPIGNVRSRLITWAEGEAAISSFFQAWWTDLERRLSAYRGWRSWNAKQQAWAVVLASHAAAQLSLFEALFTQSRKRVGNQPVIAGNWQPRETRAGVEIGVFSGMPAWKRGRGQPPLPESVALQRLHARIIARRAKNKTSTVHKDRLPLPTEAPPTKRGRPSRGETFGRKGGLVARGVPHEDKHRAPDIAHLQRNLVDCVRRNSASLSQALQEKLESFVEKGSSLLQP